MVRGISSVRHNRRGANAMRRSQAGGVGVDPPSYLVPGAYTFTAPANGDYKFVLWGGGGGAASGVSTAMGGAGSGAYCEYTRFMLAGETAAVVVGAGGIGQLTPAATSPGSASTITFGDGYQVSAGGGAIGTTGAAGAGGVAVGGDVNLNGSAGGAVGTNGDAGLGTGGGTGGAQAFTSGGGAGAPANLPYKGGNGGSVINDTNGPNVGIGAGGAPNPNSRVNNQDCGGPGAVLVNYLGAAS